MEISTELNAFNAPKHPTVKSVGHCFRGEGVGGGGSGTSANAMPGAIKITCMNYPAHQVFMY